MNKITRTWSLMSACWRLLLKDKGLLLFPLISGICCLVVMASFALPIYFTGSWEPPKSDATLQQVIYYGTLFLFYFCVREQRCKRWTLICQFIQPWLN